ncbi:MAG: hypothetical protein ACP5NS_02195 [Candidatus Pacearchaeota archaeon]
MMYRKGHVGTLLLVLGALILSVAGLFSFYSFGEDVRLKNVEFRELSLESKKMDSLIENGVQRIILSSLSLSKNSLAFEAKFNDSLKELAQAERVDSKYGNNNVFAKLANLDYILSYDGKEYTLNAKNLFYTVKSSNGLNSITRKFDLKVVFDKEKIISVKYE